MRCISGTESVKSELWTNWFVSCVDRYIIWEYQSADLTFADVECWIQIDLIYPEFHVKIEASIHFYTSSF